MALASLRAGRPPSSPPDERDTLVVHAETRALASQTHRALVAARDPRQLAMAVASGGGGSSGAPLVMIPGVGVAAPQLSEHSRVQMRRELAAAREAAESGVYVVWANPSDRMKRRRQQQEETAGGASSASGGSAAPYECCRLGQHSKCFCGHGLSEHRGPSGGCTVCTWCTRFDYVPNTPLEIGEHYLMRRAGFDLSQWAVKCRCGHGPAAHSRRFRGCSQCGRCTGFVGAFACVACDGPYEEHETMVQTDRERRALGLPVGAAFEPLAAEGPELRRLVFQPPPQRRSAAAAPAALLPPTR